MLLAILSIGILEKLSAQDKTIFIEGAVSYRTGQNIYAKFISTKGIEDGDTLFIKQGSNMIPVLKVTNHSSISCLCNYTSENKVDVGTSVFAKINLPEKEITPVDEPVEDSGIEVNEQVLKNGIPPKSIIQHKQQVNGRLSLTSYSNIYKLKENSQRFRYTLSFKGENISDSRFFFLKATFHLPTN